MVAVNIVEPSSIIDMTLFSSYEKLLGTMSKVFEAKYKFLNKEYGGAELKTKSFNYLIKLMQDSSFLDEMRFLESKPVNNKYFPSCCKF